MKHAESSRSSSISNSSSVVASSSSNRRPSRLAKAALASLAEKQPFYHPPVELKNKLGSSSRLARSFISALQWLVNKSSNICINQGWNNWKTMDVERIMLEPMGPMMAEVQ